MSSNPNMNKAPQESAPAGADPPPSNLAPQMTSTMGKPEPPPQIIQGTGSIGNPVNLNPYGFTPQLFQGAVCFDAKAIAYEQYIASQKELVVTSGMASNTVFMQLPLDPFGEYTNDFIKSWVAQHRRWAGSLLYEITITGNPLFTGNIGVCWYPNYYPSKLANLSELMKYSYQIFTVTLNSTQVFILNDATDRQFWRHTDDTRNFETAKDRPHLIFWVMTTVVNAMEPTAQIRIRLASKLPNLLDAKMMKCIPFMVSDPVANPRSIGPTPNRIEGMPFNQVFPNTKISSMFMSTDGIQTLPKIALPKIDLMKPEFSWQSDYPFFGGAVFPDTVNKRAVTSSYTGSIVGADSIRYAMITGEVPELTLSKIAQDKGFINITSKADTWLTDITTVTFVSKYLTIFTKRNISVNLLVYEKDGFKITVNQMTSLLTSEGEAYVLAYTFTFPSNSLTYAQYCGIPNLSPPSVATIPHSNVLGPLLSQTGLSVLPTSWIRLGFTRRLPMAVTSSNDIAPTFNDSVDIREYFEDLAQEAPSPTSILQFSLVDPESKSTVAVVRYLPTRGCFVISSLMPSYYKRSLVDTSTLLFNEVGFVNSSSDLLPTDLSTWANRATAQYSQKLDDATAQFSMQLQHSNSETIAHAMVAAGLDAFASGAISTAEDLPAFMNFDDDSFTGGSHSVTSSPIYNPGDFEQYWNDVCPSYNRYEYLSEATTGNGPGWSYFDNETASDYGGEMASQVHAEETSPEPLPTEDTHSEPSLEDSITANKMENLVNDQDLSLSDNANNSVGPPRYPFGGTSSFKFQLPEMDNFMKKQMKMALIWAGANYVFSQAHGGVSSMISAGNSDYQQYSQQSHENNMQNRQFQHDSDMLHQQQSYGWGTELLHAGEGVVNTLTGGVFGLVSHGMDDYTQSNMNAANVSNEQAMNIANNQTKISMNNANITAQESMNNANLANERSMNTQNIAAKVGMNNSDIASHEKMNAMNNQTSLTNTTKTVLGGIAQAATGGAAGVISSGIDDLTKVYMQKQQYNNQSALMTQHMNQSMYAMGQAAPALSMATQA